MNRVHPSPIKKYIIANIVCTLLSSMILIALPSGHLTFGYGLGDVFYFILLIVTTLVLVVLSFIKRNDPEVFKMITWIWIFVLCYTFLALTFLRGAAYPWNGHLLMH